MKDPLIPLLISFLLIQKCSNYTTSQQQQFHFELKANFQNMKKTLKSLIQQNNYIPYSEKQSILQSTFNQHKLKLNKIQQKQLNDIYKRFFPVVENFLNQKKVWLQKNKKHPVLTQNLLNYILNKVILKEEMDILDLGPSDTMVAYETIRQIIRNSQIGVEQSFKQLNNFRDQSIACNYFPFFEQNYGRAAAQLLFLDLDLIQLFKHVGMAECQQYASSCAQEIKLKLLPFFHGDHHNRVEMKCSTIRIDQQFQKNSGYLTRQGRDGKKVDYQKVLSFQTYIYHLSVFQSEQIINNVIKDPQSMDNLPYNLRMAVLYCCGDKIYDSQDLDRKLQQMMGKQQPLAYLIKLNLLQRSMKDEDDKVQFNAVYEKAIKCPNYQSNLMNYLITIEQDPQKKANIAHRMKKNQDSTSYYWLAINDPHLTQSQQKQYLQKVLNIYHKANFLLFDIESAYLQAASSSSSSQTQSKKKKKQKCQSDKVTYAYKFLSYHSLFKYGSIQQPTKLSIGQGNLFKKMVSYYQRTKYDQAFYTALLLGNLGFGQGYYSAGYLLEKKYVDSSKICRNTKLNPKQQLSNQWCAMRFYLKAILRCGDFIRSSERLTIINARVKDIKQTFHFYNLYKASIKRVDQNYHNKAAELMFSVMMLFEKESVLIAGIQAFEILIQDMRDGLISKKLFKKRLIEKYQVYYKLMKRNLKEGTVKYLEEEKVDDGVVQDEQLGKQNGGSCGEMGDKNCLNS